MFKDWYNGEDFKILYAHNKMSQYEAETRTAIRQITIVWAGIAVAISATLYYI